MPKRFESAKDLATFLSACANDLAAPASELMPDIAAVRAALEHTQGCLVARLSGSGPTCFGLYADETAAREASAQLLSQHPAWWVTPTAMLREQT